MTPRRYALAFALAAALLGGAVAAFNLAVDPYGVLGTGWLLPDSPLRDYRVRAVRSYLTRPDVPSILAFGSSRAIDGLHAGDIERLVPGARAHVFGYPLASINDHLAVLRRMTSLRPPRAPATVILLLDADTFGREAPTAAPDMRPHPAVSGADPIRFWFTYLFTLPTRYTVRAVLEGAAVPAAFRVAPVATAGEPGWMPAIVAAPEAYTLTPGPAAPHATAPAANPPPPAPGAQVAARADAPPAPAPVEVAALPRSDAPPAERIFRRRRGGGLPLPEDVDRAIAQLREFVQFCDEAGLRLVVLMSPLRAPYRAALGNAAIDAVVARLAQVVPVWTFDEAGQAGMERYWDDPSHFSPELGRRMLARALGLPMPSGPVLGRLAGRGG